MHNITNLNSDDAIITPNRRLALALREECDSQQNKENIVWAAPKIVPLTTWLQEIWLEQIAATVILNEHQIYHLWQELTQDHPLITVAINAWELKNLWLDDDKKVDPLLLTKETILFQEWADKFTSICQQYGWSDESSLANLLLQNISKLTLPKQIYLIGFDQIPTKVQRLFDGLMSKHGCLITQLVLHNHQTSAKKIAFSTFTDEITNIARWAKEILRNDADARVACIIPNLTTVRAEVETVFSAIAADDFDISIGESFADFAIINDALILLGMHQDQIDIFSLGQILLSPYLAKADEEFLARSALLNKLRNCGEEKIYLHQILSFAKQSDQYHYCPAFVEILEQLITKLKSMPKKGSVMLWAQHITQLLDECNWPSEGTMTLDEKQIVQRWQTLLTEFLSLELTHTHISYSHAVELLKSCATRAVFKPKYAGNKIKILGVLEASGLEFDHMWVAGLQEEIWPPAPNPNPFLPYQLQRQHQLPHSSTDKELQFCQTVMQRFAQSARHLIYSYHKIEQDRELNPSPLIKNTPFIDIEELAIFSDDKNVVVNKLESIIDNHAPAVSDPAKLHGGTSIFKLQATCPFRAFAERRLLTKRIEYPSIGTSAAQRGSLIHAAFESLWQTIKTSKRLHELTTQELKKVVLLSAKNAIKELQKTVPHKFNQKYRQLEERRLASIMKNLLIVEKARPNFTVVANEQQLQTTIGSIPLKLRIDRIDQLENGAQIIIDYKTGIVSKNSWFGPRPEEPQLPIYAIASANVIIQPTSCHPGYECERAYPDVIPDASASEHVRDLDDAKRLPANNIAGLTFLSVRSISIKYDGIANQDYDIHGITVIEQWNKQLQQWRDTMDQLAKDFIDGVATVDPKDRNTVCRYCSLHSLCRIYER